MYGLGCCAYQALPGEEAILGEGAFGKVFQIVTQAHGRIAVKFMVRPSTLDTTLCDHYLLSIAVTQLSPRWQRVSLRLTCQALLCMCVWLMMAAFRP
jgi:hypothetical protein